jgi:hypothetical protein
MKSLRAFIAKCFRGTRRSEISYSDIVYLDDGFIYAAYEEMTGEKPVTEVSEERSGSVLVSTGIQVGVGGKTTRKYHCSVVKILDEFLIAHPPNGIAHEPESSNCISWIHGTLRAGEWKHTRTKSTDMELCGQENTIEIYARGKRYQLLYRPEAFYPGYSVVTDFRYFTKMGLILDVNLYGRILSRNESLDTTYVIPYIVLQPKDSR